jgi:nitrite reductase/ring-hydroxylating ferredoxin subunit
MKKLLLLIFVPIVFLSCGKQTGVVPSVPVNFTASLFDPRIAPLNASGGYVVISGYGVAGLILYRTADRRYVAYDRCSSYQPEKHCAVNVDESGFTATDPCSGSKFSLADGTPVKAPATKSLRSYYVTVSASEIYVSN